MLEEVALSNLSLLFLSIWKFFVMDSDLGTKGTNWKTKGLKLCTILDHNDKIVILSSKLKLDRCFGAFEIVNLSKVS